MKATLERPSLSPKKRPNQPADSGKPLESAGDSEAYEQIAFRAPSHLKRRAERTAQRLGLDLTNFMRMILIKGLLEQEAEADRVDRGRSGS